MVAREEGTRDGGEGKDALWRLVYDELHGLAERYFRDQPANQTLQPTALVHEAYLKLAGSRTAHCNDRAHFFRTAALAMRQILVDHARSRRRRGRAKERLGLEMGEPLTDPVERAVDLISLDEALGRFAAEYPRESRVVELRYFGGLSVEQTAEVEKISPATVKRDWAFARAWLLEELAGGPPGG